MRQVKYYLFLCLFLLSIESVLIAQTEDNVIWAAAQIKKNLGEKYTFAITPIFRLNEDISSYQNMSIDISIKRKIGKGWYAQLLERTWFIPDQKVRQFIWLDVGYAKSFKPLKISSSLRYHWALDINDREDADFLRWKTTFTLLNLGKIKPFFAIEPWLRWNGFNEFQRIRYEVGFNYQIIPQLGFMLGYRREATIKIEPPRNFNMILATIIYTLPNKS